MITKTTMPAKSAARGNMTATASTLMNADGCLVAAA